MQWYRLVTSGFLHFGVIHLAFNMFLLFQLGQLLEPALGRCVSRCCTSRRCSVDRLACSCCSQRWPARWSVGRRVRASGCRRRDHVPTRRQPAHDGGRHADRAQPAHHVHDPAASPSVGTSVALVAGAAAGSLMAASPRSPAAEVGDLPRSDRRVGRRRPRSCGGDAALDRPAPTEPVAPTLTPLVHDGGMNTSRLTDQLACSPRPTAFPSDSASTRRLGAAACVTSPASVPNWRPAIRPSRRPGPRFDRRAVPPERPPTSARSVSGPGAWRSRRRPRRIGAGRTVRCRRPCVHRAR